MMAGSAIHASMPPDARTRKVKIGVSIAPALHEWVVHRVGAGAEFASVSHAVERGIALLIEREERQRALEVQSGDGQPIAQSDGVRPSRAQR